ncbi:hypothetical protein B0J11DRAFT_615780 [Dendryphion nanum]|uniref:Phytanoyl-CoA dioxygenase n=1 Tax=Dendryphion nanum TaxID=256645 RepID=A0A9P9DKF8_9PLEO|nr:hypothetical protein B0J11DRAFT_615780 [Dendryphion nanum]
MSSCTRIKATDYQGAIQALEKDGAVIVTGFTSLEELETVNNDMQRFWEHVDDKQPIDFYPDKVQTCYAVFGRSKTLREKWVLNDGFHKVCQHFLRTESIPYQGEKTEVVVNDPILSTSVSVNILPGAVAQLLHRDDMTWQQHLPDRTAAYTKEHEYSVALLVPGVDFIEANGATRIVLGSHRWPHDKRGKPSDTICAEMKRGEALLILGSVAHGGGANRTQTNRILHSVFVCRAWLRPESNIMPLFPRSEVEQWSPEAQYMGGYRKGALFLGHSDSEDPIKVLPEFTKLRT